MHLFSFMNIFNTVKVLWPGQGLLHATKQKQLFQKPKMQDLSSLFRTHRFNVMHAPVKFHEYLPHGLGGMARTRFTIWNLVKDR